MKELDAPRMTYEEVIDTLKGLAFGSFDRTTFKEREALDKAIKILEADNTEEINCKDCKYYTKKGDRWGECDLYNIAVDQMYSCGGRF